MGCSFKLKRRARLQAETRLDRLGGKNYPAIATESPNNVGVQRTDRTRGWKGKGGGFKKTGGVPAGRGKT